MLAESLRYFLSDRTSDDAGVVLLEKFPITFLILARSPRNPIERDIENWGGCVEIGFPQAALFSIN